MPRHTDEVYEREQRSSSRREPRERDIQDSRSDRRDRNPPRETPHTNSRRIVDDRMDYRDTRLDDAMDTRMDMRMDARMDNRLDSRTDRIDPRANAGARIDRSERNMDRHNREQEVLYKDPRTGEIYRENPYGGRTYARDDPDEMIPSKRPIIDQNLPRERDDIAAPQYNDYFVPGEGIDREVIQHEICKYLGQDAFCRPYRNTDGRQGYLVRAYRPFTTAMIKSLIEDTRRWRAERDKRAKSGRSQGSYAEMRDRQEAMDVDEYDPPPPSRHRDPDPRGMISSRHAQPVVPVGYPPEPGYPGYSLSSTQPGNYGADAQPRTSYAGNTTPPTTGRSSQIPYGQSGGYPPRSSAAAAPPILGGAYTDPRTGELVRVPAPGYPSESTGRHARR